MGYAGLRFDENGLLFNPLPGTLTPATKSMRLRNLFVRGTYPVDYTVDATSVQFSTARQYSDILCLTDHGGKQWKVTSDGLKLNFQDIDLPVRLDQCA